MTAPITHGEPHPATHAISAVPHHVMHVVMTRQLRMRMGQEGDVAMRLANRPKIARRAKECGTQDQPDQSAHIHEVQDTPNLIPPTRPTGGLRYCASPEVAGRVEPKILTGLPSPLFHQCFLQPPALRQTSRLKTLDFVRRSIAHKAHRGRSYSNGTRSVDVLFRYEDFERKLRSTAV
jgi:hypothetical protein